MYSSRKYDKIKQELSKGQRARLLSMLHIEMNAILTKQNIGFGHDGTCKQVL